MVSITFRCGNLERCKHKTPQITLPDVRGPAFIKRRMWEMGWDYYVSPTGTCTTVCPGCLRRTGVTLKEPSQAGEGVAHG